MLEFRQLQCFAEVAQTGSLTKSALQLNVSHSILSREIQDFEMELGHRLFHRTGRGMKLTEFGRQLLPRAQRLILEASRFADEASTLRGRLSGAVAIGLPGSVAALIAMPLHDEARRKYPDIFLRFVEGLSGGVEELLASGRVDIGLFYASKPDARRGDIALAASSLYLVGPRKDTLTAKGTVTLSQVARCPLLLPSRPHAVRTMVDEACSYAGLQIYIACEIDSLLALKEVVARGMGYTVCTYDAVAADVQAGRLKAALIRDPPLTRLLVMAMGSKTSVTIAARAISDLILALAERCIAQGRWRPPAS